MKIMELFVSFVPLLVILFIQDSTAKPSSFWSGFFNPTTESVSMPVVEDTGYGSLYNNLNTGGIKGPVGDGNGPQHDIIIGISGHGSYSSNNKNSKGVEGLVGDGNPSQHDIVIGVTGIRPGDNVRNNENSGGVKGPIGNNNGPQYNIKVGTNV